MGSERFATWTKITADEMKAFLGFSILMGINQLPAVKDYWRKNEFLHYSPIADRIPRDRFLEISRYVYFVDNSTLQPRGSPGHDRLGKVRPVIEHLSAKFAQSYHPHKEVAVDEAMMKFQGRSSLKQYMPQKPIKRGIKGGSWVTVRPGTFPSSTFTAEKAPHRRRTWEQELSRPSQNHSRESSTTYTSTTSSLMSS